MHTGDVLSLVVGSIIFAGTGVVLWIANILNRGDSRGLWREHIVATVFAMIAGIMSGLILNITLRDNENWFYRPFQHSVRIGPYGGDDLDLRVCTLQGNQ